MGTFAALAAFATLASACAEPQCPPLALAASASQKRRFDKCLHRGERLCRAYDLDTVALQSLGRVDLSFAVENTSNTSAFGPVQLTLTGVPSSVQVVSSNSTCVRQGLTVACKRGWLLPHEVWFADVRLEAHPCDWLAINLHAAVADQSGLELNPQDNSLDVAVRTGSAWPMWKLCASRWGEAPYHY
jgi:hypothetical protein